MTISGEFFFRFIIIVSVGAFLISNPIGWIILVILAIAYVGKNPGIFKQLALWGIIALGVVGLVTVIALLGFILPIVIALLPFIILIVLAVIVYRFFN